MILAAGDTATWAFRGGPACAVHTSPPRQVLRAIRPDGRIIQQEMEDEAPAFPFSYCAVTRRLDEPSVLLVRDRSRRY